MKFHRPRNPFKYNPFKRKQKETYVAFTYGEAKELLKKMGPDDTLVMDEEGPPLFSSSRDEDKSARAEPKKKARKCPECDKELPAGWSMILCASCATEAYGTIKDPPPPPDPTDDYAKVERDKDGRPRLTPVSVKGVKNRFRRNVLVGCLVFLIVCSGLSVISYYYQPPSHDYYVVSGSMIETYTNQPSASVMTLYLYQNGSWVEHDARTMLKLSHVFSPIPLGVWASVRVRDSVDGEWGPEPAFARAVFVNSTDYFEEISFIWEHYTIILEGRGSDVLSP